MLNILQFQFCRASEMSFNESFNFQFSVSMLSHLLWTLRPGNMLPGVAGMVTTICSVTLPSSRFQTNILQQISELIRVVIAQSHLLST